MDEILNIHGIKFIHGIMVARRDIHWLGTSVGVRASNNEPNLLELKKQGLSYRGLAHTNQVQQVQRIVWILEGLLSSFKGPSSNQKKEEKNYGVRQPMEKTNQGQSDFLGQKLWQTRETFRHWTAQEILHLWATWSSFRESSGHMLDFSDTLKSQIQGYWRTTVAKKRRLPKPLNSSW